MSKAILSTKQRRALLDALSKTERASIVSLKELIQARKVPARLRWAPDICVRRAKDTLLVHVLVSADFPAYLERAIEQLKEQRFKRTHVLLLARDVVSEAGEDGPHAQIAAPTVARSVAEKALALGCALTIEYGDTVYSVFPENYHPPPPDECQDETGHIPKWLYRALAEGSAFSPYLNRTFKAFAKKYGRSTQGLTITNEREGKLVMEFAERFARGDKRLYFPIGQLLVLREFEAAKVTRTRDHFFHTFNNLFLGFYIS